MIARNSMNLTWLSSIRRNLRPKLKTMHTQPKLYQFLQPPELSQLSQPAQLSYSQLLWVSHAVKNLLNSIKGKNPLKRSWKKRFPGIFHGLQHIFSQLLSQNKQKSTIKATEKEQSQRTGNIRTKTQKNTIRTSSFPATTPIYRTPNRTKARQSMVTSTSTRSAQWTRNHPNDSLTWY